jgi:hypothetical protein
MKKEYTDENGKRIIYLPDTNNMGYNMGGSGRTKKYKKYKAQSNTYKRKF